MSTLLLKILAWTVGCIPWRAAQRIGSLAGLAWYRLVPIRKRVALSNIALSLPNHPSPASVARDAYRHLGMSIFELLKTTRMKPDDICSKIHPHNLGVFERATAQGRGVIVVTAHFGNFDLLAVSQAAAGVPLAIVSKDLSAGGVNTFWMAARRRCGLAIFPEKGAARQLLRWLRRGGVVGLTADQRTSPDRGGIRVPFMRRAAWTDTAAAALALATGAPIIPVRLERRPDGDHDLIVDKEVSMPTVRTEETIRQLTEEINRVIGGWIARRPEQWLWLHKRFRDYKTKEPA